MGEYLRRPGKSADRGSAVRAPAGDVPGGQNNAIFRLGTGQTARFPLRAEDPREVALWFKSRGSSCGGVPVEVSPLSAAAVFHKIPARVPAASVVRAWLPRRSPPPPRSHPHPACWPVRPINSIAPIATPVVDFSRAGTRGRHRRSRRRDECLRKSADIFDVDPLRRLWARFKLLPPGGKT